MARYDAAVHTTHKLCGCAITTVDWINTKPSQAWSSNTFQRVSVAQNAWDYLTLALSLAERLNTVDQANQGEVIMTAAVELKVTTTMDSRSVL
jgi:hypothetical protein